MYKEVAVPDLSGGGGGEEIKICCHLQWSSLPPAKKVAERWCFQWCLSVHTRSHVTIAHEALDFTTQKLVHLRDPRVMTSGGEHQIKVYHLRIPVPSADIVKFICTVCTHRIR